MPGHGVAGARPVGTLDGVRPGRDATASSFLFGGGALAHGNGVIRRKLASQAGHLPYLFSTDF